MISAGAAAAVVLTVIIVAERKLSNLVVGGLGESFSTRIYSAPLVIDGHLRRTPEAVIERLQRLSYRPGSAASPGPGFYDWSPPVLSVHLRGFHSPSVKQEPARVRLIWERDGSWTVKDETGATLPQAVIEPEVIAELSGPQKVRRDPATWEEFPPHLVHAVVAIEDHRFFRHWGLDPRAIARAAWKNVTRRNRLEGGSTITQQLAKNLFLKPKRTLWRKIKEAALALYLTMRYSKERILTLYLNHIYMGQDGFTSVAGMKSAARFYFGKDLSELTLPDAATLAGVIRSPHNYGPHKNPVPARRRRNIVLRRMMEEGYISAEEHERAKAAPMGPLATETYREENANEYFVAEVVRRLIPIYSEDDLFRHGLKIFTTMDPIAQKAAQSAVRPVKTQAALVSMDADTGAVIALTGGRNYRESQFNRATQALRQPGSAFKPFVFGAALEQNFTPATLLQDEPRAYAGAKSGIWAPQNFDHVYHGTVTVRQALAWSLNAATLGLAEKVGPAYIARFAQKLGISSPIDGNLSIALGASEVNPLELTAAYAPFANGGFRVSPYFVTAVLDAENEVLETGVPERRSVIDPALAFLMTSLLETVITEGTARSLAALGWALPAAGKTGTTNEGRDAWFVGYTPELVTGVWAGLDDARAANLSGARHAIPIWAAFMKEIYKGRPARRFEQPMGLVKITIDPVTGLLPRSGCPSRSAELFIMGTEPREYCAAHSGGLKGWFRRLFGSN